MIQYNIKHMLALGVVDHARLSSIDKISRRFVLSTTINYGFERFAFFVMWKMWPIMPLH
jgi:hypothetical protein